MQMHKVEFFVSFNYFGHSLSYSKLFELPFIPFYGLIMDFDDDICHTVELVNNDYTKTRIYYNIKDEQFVVDVSTYWKRPVSDDTIDHVLKEYKDWECLRDTNIVMLKELMNRKKE